MTLTAIETQLAGPLESQASNPLEITLDATPGGRDAEPKLVSVQLRAPNRHSRGRSVPDPRQLQQKEYLKAERAAQLAQARQLVQVSPESPTAWSRLAQCLIGQGRVEEAVEAAERTLATIKQLEDPRDASLFTARFVAARVLAVVGRIEDAERALQELPEEGAWAILYADLATRRGDYTLALERIGGARTVVTSAYTGFLLLRLGRPEEALAALRSALRDGESSPSLWMNLAYAYASIGSPKKAIRSARKAVSISPQSRSASFNLVSYLRASGLFSEALEELRRLRTVVGDGDPRVAAAMAQALTDCGNPQEGLRELRRAQHHTPFAEGSSQQAELKVNLAALEWRLGEAAMDEVVEVIRQQLNSAGPSVALGQMLADFGTKSAVLPEVERVYDALVASEPLETLMPLRVRMELLRGRVTEAAELSVAYAEKNPLDINELRGAVFFRGHILGDYEGAASMGLRALRRAPADRMLLNNTVFSLAHAGRAHEADRLLVDGAPLDDPYLRATRGLVDLALGRTDEGLAHYEAASEMIRTQAMHPTDKQDLEKILRANEAMAVHRFGIGEDGTPPSLTTVELPREWESDLRFSLLHFVAKRLNVRCVVEQV